MQLEKCRHKAVQESENYIKVFYKSRMKKKNEFGTIFELRAAADLFQFHFDFVREIQRNTFVVKSCRSYDCAIDVNKPRKFFLYTKYRQRHWEFLRPSMKFCPSTKNYMDAISYEEILFNDGKYLPMTPFLTTNYKRIIISHL
ncbi:unnamed protein product [Allacma fusca]|uniref:Uncharacterized protein n=1 Tax=Allacma fusca TaxID=39272 RepID=A0A8J2PCN4_9HEXA|nr:unnamed protein product [Allacma fusca]